MTGDRQEEIEAAIKKARFSAIVPPPGARAYDAKEDGWRILVIASAGPQGRHYDGTAARELPLEPEEAILQHPPKPKLDVVRLSTELAKLAVSLAEKQVFS